uniref:Ethylene receptor n=1 Tax=Noccaea caerulescens TaxID=107243 RepID=A0A1J3CKM9_NOCCA
MVRELASQLLILSTLLLICVSPALASGNGGGCNCEYEGGSFWTTENILETQRVSDFLIAVAYFSIPIELLYFVSCSNVPFKWVLFEFIAFIVLCGMTHLLHGWTYSAHPFKLMMALTVFKMLTALVSCATAITLVTLIPLLLKVKVREFMLKKKAHELGREVGLIMIQKETGFHVRMLTQEIRKSLDRHTILYTTLVELSKTLGLQNCAVWMESDGKMNLTHELRGRSGYNDNDYSVSVEDLDVVRVRESDEVNVLSVDSLIARASGGGMEIGHVAAIRMPMLRVADFKGGATTTELIQTCYAILVCVLPSGGEARDWNWQEIEIVKVVADQVAVALSHAAVLEESHMMREKLAEQNRALQMAKRDAVRASQARNVLQKTMSEGMRRPMHSILGLLSMIQDEKLSNEQKMVVDTMVKTGNVMSNLVGDAMDVSDGRFVTEMKPFSLHRTIREAACLARCLCLYNGFRFEVDAEKSLPENVVGDERRVFQVILHMVGSLVKPRKGQEGLLVTFRVLKERGSLDRSDQRWAAWRSPASSADGDVYIRFEMNVENDDDDDDSSSQSRDQEVGDMRFSGYGLGQDLSFGVCKKVVQLIQGNISVVPGSDGSPETMSLLLRFRRRPSISVHGSSESPAPDHHLHPNSNSLLRGLQVLLVDTNDSNRAVTRKLLEKLGCSVTAVSSGFDCLTALAPGSSSSSSSFQVVVLDLQMAETDGYEVAMRIRSRSWPLIVAMTVSLDEEIWDKCVQIGINGVVRKPVVLRAMESELRRVLSQADQLL